MDAQKKTFVAFVTWMYTPSRSQQELTDVHTLKIEAYDWYEAKRIADKYILDNIKDWNKMIVLVKNLDDLETLE